MRKRKLLRGMTYLLLLSMLTASIPFHQIFHKHTFSSSYIHDVDNAGYKTPEKSCCKLLHVLPAGILVSFVKTTGVPHISTSVAYSVPEKVSLFVHSFLNKAPPVVLA